MTQNHRDLLREIGGIGETTVDRLLDHFGHGYWVAQSACRYWGELTKVEGITEDRARTFFDAMTEAGVFDALNTGGMLVEALEQGHRGDDHGGGA